MTEPCIIRKGIFDRWVIFKADDDTKAWSGSRWVSCGEDGRPDSVQVCNFETEQEARDFCRMAGLEPQRQSGS